MTAKEKRSCYDCVYIDGDGCKKIPGPRMNIVWCDKWKSTPSHGEVSELEMLIAMLQARVTTLEEALRAAADSLQTIAGSYPGKIGMEDLTWIEMRQYAASRAMMAKKALEEK